MDKSSYKIRNVYNKLSDPLRLAVQTFMQLHKLADGNEALSILSERVATLLMSEGKIVGFILVTVVNGAKNNRLFKQGMFIDPAHRNESTRALLLNKNYLQLKKRSENLESGQRLSGIMHTGRIPNFKLVDHNWEIKGKTNQGVPVFVRNF
jgi:hypothetical protein